MPIVPLVAAREREVEDWIAGMAFVRTLGMACVGAEAGVAVCRLDLRDETPFAVGLVTLRPVPAAVG